jgi:lysylphosphatidylglycerol synthetase-like protein (DUF2156 family)
MAAIVTTPPNPGGAVRVSPGTLVRGDRVLARWIGVLTLLCASGWLTVLAAQHHLLAGWHGGLSLPVAIAAATALIGRGIFLGRPVTAAHAAIAAVVACAGVAVHIVTLDLLGNVLLASAGWLLMWPTTARPQPETLPRVWPLVDAARRDPLAPFAMDSHKSYHFNADDSAALAYRTRLGFAVVSGDPIGEESRFAALVADFARMCRGRGWRIIVLGCSQRRLPLWRNEASSPGTLAVPIGRDVVIDVQRFTMTGRRFRNLRQAVQRTRNAGISTQVIAEQDLDDTLTAELYEVLTRAHGGARTERGFSMTLDGALQRRYPGVKLIIARDRRGRVQAFHRYATAGHGSEVSLDVPFRRPGAPNGIDERLSVDMIADAKAHHAQRLSLAFAAFPEIFDNTNRGPLHRAFYRLIHLLDPLIALESLYRYLCKFHELGEQRYAVLCAHHIPTALPVLLSLEFMPRWHQRLTARTDKADRHRPPRNSFSGYKASPHRDVRPIRKGTSARVIDPAGPIISGS